jgi:hypothetical protein
VGFDVLTTYQSSTVWCSRERLAAAAAQPPKVRQSCSATDYYYYYYYHKIVLENEISGSRCDEYEDVSFLGCCNV